MVDFKENIPVISIPESQPVIIRLVQASEFRYEPGEVVPSHTHQIPEIRFIIKGKLKTYVGKKRYLASDNSLYFIKAGDTHYQYTISETRMYHLAFFISNVKPQGIYRHPPNDNIKQKYIDLLKKIAKYPSVVFDAPENIINSLNEIYKNFHVRNPDYIKISELFRRFLIQFSEILYAKTRYKEPARMNLAKFNYRTRRIFNKLIRRIKTNYNKPINLHYMAKELNVCSRHFERIFKHVAGCTPTEYLMRARICKSLKLLKKPRAKIENIIREVGFNNNGRFYKFFKKYIGVSPCDYKSYSTENKEVITDLFKQE